jgi:hypothetical protein
MAHVLGVSALKFGHPVGVLVLMEANDFLFHGLTVRAADGLLTGSSLPGSSAAASSNIDSAPNCPCLRA